MKRRELETKDQMMYVDQPKNVVRQNQWEQREIVQTVGFPHSLCDVFFLL